MHLCHLFFFFNNQNRNFKKKYILIKAMCEMKETLSGSIHMLMGPWQKAYYLTGMRQLFIVVTSARVKMINSRFLSLHIL